MSHHPEAARDQILLSEGAERLEAVRRYVGVEPPADGSFDRIAGMAAAVFEAPVATVSVVDEGRVWFLAARGLNGVTEIGDEPGLCASAVLADQAYVVRDADVDPRTLNHPLVRGELGIRFYAAAPIITSDGHALGTVNVLGFKRRRRVSDTQMRLLNDLAATVAQILETRLSALAVIRAERRSRSLETDRRDRADSVREKVAEAAASEHRTVRAEWCQLGGVQGCQERAEMKVTDSWGDSAWGCFLHAEDALINVPSAFLATESTTGLAAYRSGRLSS